MAKKKEMEFLTKFKNSCKHHKIYFYKIPDTPVAPRFIPSKPFDAYMGIGGALMGFEAKYMDGYHAFGLRHIREVQILGLDRLYDHNATGYIALFLKAHRGQIRALFWEWTDFKELCLQNNGSIKKKQLESHPYVVFNKQTELFDLTDFITLAKTNISYQYLIQ